MAREVIKLHTIDQWLRLDRGVQAVVLQNIKLRDRLYQYLYSLNEKKNEVTEPRWVRCSKCAESPHPGWILQEPRYDGIHPSQLGQPCLKKTYFDMVGAPSQERVEPRLRLIFDLGHAVHHMFQTYGLNGAWGPTYTREAEISGEYQEIAERLMIEGHADGDNLLVIDNIPNAPIYEVGIVHEYKTINQNGFEKLTSPKPEHRVQAMVYARALDRPIVVYMYLNKNDSNIADFPIAFDPEAWARLESKVQVLLHHYNNKTPPEGEVGFHCRDCKYVFSCDSYRAAQPQRR